MNYFVFIKFDECWTNGHYFCAFAINTEQTALSHLVGLEQQRLEFSFDGSTNWRWSVRLVCIYKTNSTSWCLKSRMYDQGVYPVHMLSEMLFTMHES